MNNFLCRLCGIGVAVALAGLAHADERILDFHSAIAIGADAGMQVSEAIRVRAEGDRIRHGIYRDFPTDYRDRYGNRVHVDFEPVALTRDAAREPFHTEAQENGVRVYFGDKDTLLAPGEYTYVLEYRTTRQLGFFADRDELYWNVTGNGWDFAIDTASAAVALPGSIAVQDIHAEAYTGAQGAKGADYRARVDGPSHAVVQTTRPLAPREGLTVVVTFPKGIVAAPTGADNARWFLRDNAGVLIGAGGLLLVWLYYLWQWLRVGRDPKAGVIIPQYEAPDGFSPGALRHIERMKYDDRCFAADVVDLGVRGALTIRQEGSTFSLHRAAKARELPPPAEAALLESALGNQDQLDLIQSEHTTIAAALSAHKAMLTKENAGRYFHTNSTLVIPGVLLCLLALLLGLFARGATPTVAGVGFMLVWLSGWSVGVTALVAGAIKAWRQPSSAGAYAAALAVTFFALPFILGELVGIGMFVWMAGIGFALVVAALIVTNIAFFQWLKAPTIEGRKLLDRIAGLRLYLGVAERDELARQTAPPMTVDEFQKFLPYALALGVEQTWADRFAAVVGPAAAAAAAGAMTWYQGNTSGLYNLGSFTSGLGSSLSGAISSSSTAPGSSSGSGGGGSSGGGGGGGGGGGW
jgi:predicted membrane protein DUF2207